jgi:hypothetical protein
MQIILLEKVVNLGNLGDVVRVKDGYARNFLIPGRHAKRATANAIKEFEAKRAELEKAAADKLAAQQAIGEKLAGTKSGCGWSFVWLGNEPRHRRRADKSWFRCDEGANPYACWPNQIGWRQRGIGGTAHRCGR